MTTNTSTQFDFSDMIFAEHRPDWKGLPLRVALCMSLQIKAILQKSFHLTQQSMKNLLMECQKKSLFI